MAKKKADKFVVVDRRTHKKLSTHRSKKVAVDKMNRLNAAQVRKGNRMTHMVVVF